LNLRRFNYFTFILYSFGESCLLVSWCVAGRCGMTCSDWDRGRSMISGAKDQGMVAQVSYVVVGRLRGRMTLCGLHRARGDKERGFLG
jgi:hypothetical protein